MAVTVNNTGYFIKQQICTLFHILLILCVFSLMQQTSWIIPEKLAPAYMRNYLIWSSTGIMINRIVFTVYSRYLYYRYLLKNKTVKWLKHPEEWKRWGLLSLVICLTVLVSYICLTGGNIRFAVENKDTVWGIYIGVANGFEWPFMYTVFFFDMLLEYLCQKYGKKIAGCMLPFIYATYVCMPWSDLERENLLIALVSAFIFSGIMVLVVYATESMVTVWVVQCIVHLLLENTVLLALQDDEVNDSLFRLGAVCTERWLKGSSEMYELQRAFPAVLGYVVMGCIAFRVLKQKKERQDGKAKSTDHRG